MNSLLSSLTKESMFIKLVDLSLTIIKDAFANIGGNIGEIPNHRRETVAREMISLFMKKY